jgi:hypothetical protein
MRDNPGCAHFASRTTETLNLVVRPLTAKWHRAYEEGRLDSRDGGDVFRSELIAVQEVLRVFAEELHEMAYGERARDALSPAVMSEEALDDIFHSAIDFGFMFAAGVAATGLEAIQADEAACVDRRRVAQHRNVAAGQNAVGLALSGGGIRSASFSLGVVQMLAHAGMLSDVDFLSTVSGGGYTGSFLTRRLDDGCKYNELAAPYGPDTDPIRYLRQNARYLSGRNLKERWSMACATLAGMALNWAAPLLVIVVCVLTAHFFGERIVEIRPTILIWLAAATIVTMIGYGAGMRCGKRASHFTGNIFGWTLAATLAVAVTAGLDACCHDLLSLDEPHKLVNHWKVALSSIVLSVGGIGTALPAITRFVPVFKNPKLRHAALQAALWIAGLFVPCMAIVLFYLLLGLTHDQPQWLIVAGVFLAVVSFGVVNINLTAPHRLYRDDLARTFISTGSADDAAVPLRGINHGDAAPYHILNSALNVPSSQTASLKDRGCDFFMFSKHWTGSASSGYCRTSEWKSDGQTDIDLATANGR